MWGKETPLPLVIYLATSRLSHTVLKFRFVVTRLGMEVSSGKEKRLATVLIYEYRCAVKPTSQFGTR